MLKSPLLPAFFRWRVLTTSTEGRSGNTAKNLRFVAKTLLIMNFTAIFVFVGCLSATAAGHGQNISLKLKDEPLQKLFNEIQKQTDYSFVYFEDDLTDTKKIDVQVNNVTLEEVLELTFKNQTLSYTIVDKSIIIKLKPSTPSGALKYPALYPPPPITVRGRIVNEKGEPVVASVIVKGSNQGTTSDANGNFILANINNTSTLIISGIGIETSEIKVNNRLILNISTLTRIGSQEEVVINGGYYKVEDRKRTGNISRVESRDIERQPVTSPLLALQGRVAGLDVTPQNGAPGSAPTIRIRGVNSLRNFSGPENGNYPLYIVDGVIINSRNVESVNNGFYINGTDPLSVIGTANIESIEILKDGDATAIYGSRGANGVVLITTKKRSKTEKTNLDLAMYTGFGKLQRHLQLLSREQYLEMRHEAISNDGGSLLPYDYDLNGFWDSTRSTDWQKELLGKASRISDIQLNFSGGNTNTSFRFGGEYFKETSIMSGDFGLQRLNANIGVNHQSTNRRFNTSISMNYGSAKNNLFGDGSYMAAVISLPSIAPALYDSVGGINWQKGDGGSETWVNPLSYTKNTYYSKSSNLIMNGMISYQLFDGLTLSTSLGYTEFNAKDNSLFPLTYYSPSYVSFGIKPSALFGSTQRSSWIIEPQANYSWVKQKHQLNIILGGSLQQSINQNDRIEAVNYPSDAFLGNIRAAQATRVTLSSETEYNYIGAFARIGYQFSNKYLANVTARRDGSSRFGPGNRFGNFGAIGAAWIFSNENWIKDNLSFLSFGKLRSSWGITGNDQIPDYQYFEAYGVSNNAYQGVTAISPIALSNPGYSWEITKKLEFAINLGFIKDRINVEFAWYRNRSSNQLVDNQLAPTAGFPTIFGNFPATVQNTGIEVVLATQIINTSNLKWISEFNLSIPKNKLTAFPGLEQSAYAQYYKIGEPLALQSLYTYTGVDKATGEYTFADINNDGFITPDDMQLMLPLDKKFYGGLNNRVRFKSLEVSFLFQFAKMINKRTILGFPGTRTNQPAYVTNRWRKPGDNTDVQRYNANYLLFSQMMNFGNSDYAFEDASFIRLKTVSVSYLLPQFWKGIQTASVFIQGQNLLTFTEYNGWDPESGPTALPPMRIINFGLQVKF